jgi:ribose transport system substrate-binding protein
MKVIGGKSMTGKYLKLLILSTFLSVLLTACHEAGSQKEVVHEEKQASKKTIALVMKTLTNPFFIDMEKGAREAEKEFDINLIVKTGAKETSIEQQIAIVENLIHSKVDAIVIAPGSSTELIPVLKKAQDAKIPIVNIDNRLDPQLSAKMGLVNVPFISVDNENGAYLAVKYIADGITKPTNAVIIEGIRGVDNAEQRKKGALKGFEENRNIKIVASETANWNIDEGYSVMERILSSKTDIGLVFCANDMMALGAVQYLEKAGKKDVLVAGYDALAEAKNAISNGKMAVTIDQQASQQGYIGIKYALDMINGLTLKETVKLVDVKVINRDNIK